MFNETGGSGSSEQTQESEAELRAQDIANMKQEFADRWRKIGNMSEDEIQELQRLEDISTNHLPLKDQIRLCELTLKTENPSQAARMVAEIGSINAYDEVHPETLIRFQKIVRKYINAILYFQGKQVGDDPKGEWAKMN